MLLFSTGTHKISPTNTCLRLGASWTGSGRGVRGLDAKDGRLLPCCTRANVFNDMYASSFMKRGMKVPYCKVTDASGFAEGNQRQYQLAKRGHGRQSFATAKDITNAKPEKGPYFGTYRSWRRCEQHMGATLEVCPLCF